MISASERPLPLSRPEGPRFARLAALWSTVARDPARALALVLTCGLALWPALVIGGALQVVTPLVLAVLALTLGLVARRPAPPSVPYRAFLLLLALPVLVLALQLVPLPRGALQVLSPAVLALRPSEDTAPLSLSPSETFFALCQSAALFFAALVVPALRLHGFGRRRLRDAIIAAGVLQALVAAVHLTLHNRSSILWLYPLPAAWDSALGTFVNRNHAASLLLCGAVLAAGALFEKARAHHALALALQLVALWASGSRAALGVGLLYCLLLPALLSRRGALWPGLVGALVAVGGAVTLVVSPAWQQRLAPLFDGSIGDYQKVRAWRDALALIADYPLVGVGGGAFLGAFPAYRTGDEYVQVPYPASLPLQHAASYGVPATLGLWLLGIVVALALWRGRRRLSPQDRAAALCALAVVLHCLAEYSLELLGVSLPVVLALATSLDALTLESCPSPGSRPTRAGQALALLAPTLCLLLALWAQAERPALLQSQKLRLQQALRVRDLRAAEVDFQEARQQHPADPQIQILGAAAALQGGDLAAVLSRANAALARHPADVAAHRLTVHALLRAGRREQAAVELRQCFWRGLPPTPEALRQAESLVGVDALPDVLRQHPGELRGLAAHLRARGRPDLAAACENRAAWLTPGDPNQARR